jgi:RHS repeat-associated protein
MFGFGFPSFLPASPRTLGLTYRVAGASALVVAFLSCSVVAQLNPGTETALPPNSVYHGSGLDKVNLQNGNLHIEIPLLSLPQRGGKTLTWKYVYDSQQWQALYVAQAFPLLPYYVVSEVGTQGWRLESPLGWLAQPVDTPLTCASTSTPYTQVTYDLFDPQGTQHLVGVRTESTPCLGEVVSGPALDGSGIMYNSQTNIITLKDGTQISPLAGNIQDVNGNTIFNPSSGDSLGQAGLSTTNGTTASGAPYTLYSFYDSNGVQQSYRVDFTQITLQSDLCSIEKYSTCYGGGGGGWMPSMLTLPNSTTYLFAYNNNTPGELQQMTVPTGATIAYTYEDGYFGHLVPKTAGINWYGAMAVTSRTVTVGGIASKWTYSGSFGLTGWTNTGGVTDPAGNVETHTFSYLTLSSGGTPTTSQYETGVTYAGPTGNILRTIAKTYTGELNKLYNIPVNLRVIGETTTLDNGQSKTTQTTYETFSYGSGNFAGIATRLNPTQVSDYDFGGALLRTTNYTYLQTNNPTYTNLNIVDKPTTIITNNGAGTQMAETVYEYDVYSHPNQPMVASGAIQHSSSFSTSYTTRGNVTAVEHWRNTDGSFLTSTNQYDDAGNVLSTIDPLGNKTSFAYTDSWSNSTCAPSGSGKAYVTTVTNALSQVATKTYDSCTGYVASTTDVNSNQTSYLYDLLGRTTSVTDPKQVVNGTSMNGVTTYVYTDTVGNVNIEKKNTINSSSSTNEFFYFDGLGRGVSHSRANGESTAWDKIDTCYDLNGRKLFGSYPYQAASTTAPANCSSDIGDTYAYDPLSRLTTVTHSDGTVATTSYTGRATEVQDEGNGNANASQRVSQIDGLGRLVSVCEVTSVAQQGPGGTPAACGQDIAKTGFLTTYAYDALGNLLTVSQGNLSQRSFTYNSLLQVITSTNPESGTTCYGVWQSDGCVNGYDLDGNLLSRTRPAPNQTSSTTYVTTSYQYDALNRVSQTSYSDGKTPTATFVYDKSNVTVGASKITITNGIGRLSSTCTLSGSICATMSAFSYDTMGRTLLDQQATPTEPNGYAFNYTYDLIGDALTSSDGNGIDYTLSYNVAPRLTQMTSNWLKSGSQTGGNLIGSLHYNSFGDPLSSSLYNGLAESWTYDARGRVQTYAAGTSYSFSVTNSSSQDGYSGNGSVLNAEDTFNGTWAYAYDDFNRISTSSCTATCPDGQSTQAFTYQYDRYGNRWNQTVTAGSGPQPQLTFKGPRSVPNNRIDGQSYDAAGNLLSDGNHSYTYDAENRLIQVDSGSTGTYTYDADGRRITRETASGSWEYLYDLGGRAVTELVAGTTTTNRSEGYAGGRHLVTQNFGTTYFIHSDWLGTERARTSLTGGSAVESCQSLPFGDGQVCTNTDVSPMHFTGKERDTESNLDDFDARYYSSQWARFMTPDWDAKPIAVPYAKYGDPQSLNLYAYVENAPLNRVDADGHSANGGGNEPHANFLAPSEDACIIFNGPTGCPLTVSTPAYYEAEAESAYDAMVAQTTAYNAEQSAIRTGAAQNNNVPPPPDLSNLPLSTRQVPSLSSNVLSPLDSTGITALQAINPTSIREDKEYASRAYKNPDGTYSAMPFNPGTQAGSPHGPISGLPAGTTNAALLHTHGGNDPGYDNEHFSPQDRGNAQREGVPSYLATPSGSIQRYDPGTNRVTILVPGSNQ